MKRFLVCFLILAMAASLLAGCGAKSAKDDSLDKVKKSGELHISTSPDFAPMEFVDTSKSGQEQYVGFDMDLARYIADYLGVKLVIEPMSFEACQASVATGSVDMSVSGYSRTTEREENFLMSDNYYTGNEEDQVIVMLKDNAAAATTAESFKGKLLSAQNASLQWNLLTEQLPDAEANMIGDLGVAILEVSNGQVDGLCCAKGQAEIFCANDPNLAICPWSFTIDDDANLILLPKGADALCAEVNKALAECKDQWSGWYAAAKELSLTDVAQEQSIPDEPTDDAAKAN